MSKENTVVLRVPVAIAPSVRRQTLEHRIQKLKTELSKLEQELSELVVSA